MESTPSLGTSTKNTAEKPKKKCDFKLCFPFKQRVGYATGNYTNKVSVVTSKFYSKMYLGTYNQQDLQNHIHRLKFCSPRQKYKLPKTENQRYGWYQPVVSKNDSYANYSISTSQLVKEHLMNYAKIRE